jgi:hypothetical protein
MAGSKLSCVGPGAKSVSTWHGELSGSSDPSLRYDASARSFEGIEKCGRRSCGITSTGNRMNPAFFGTPHARVVTRETDDQSPYRALLSTRIHHVGEPTPQGRDHVREDGTNGDLKFSR